MSSQVINLSVGSGENLPSGGMLFTTPLIWLWSWKHDLSEPNPGVYIPTTSFMRADRSLRSYNRGRRKIKTRQLRLDYNLTRSHTTPNRFDRVFLDHSYLLTSTRVM
ncbi:hypothetical protein TREMEDRAFT_60877 [Tremella mesenterica DSM 1558]|uniref:uncharacterized protein n=1 Tax=Tremella mesenterica (strain ATCC 24925 / CBS 8224 / DSM 1558 / NBRC 9311 / NRRL Y-6157 / RJB 2259-6 / UBC 559-6) TaxID=578456 RepID=UPI0003F49E59|nr:uncharacterized protein TREMEDRAFT_60877 [Tremella mesenterica DSM 1558]EIW70382.1 hypothetical protein TREMEDRAFT_60877 [Tremella mesenterica DSM 1558]